MGIELDQSRHAVDVGSSIHPSIHSSITQVDEWMSSSMGEEGEGDGKEGGELCCPFKL